VSPPTTPNRDHLAAAGKRLCSRGRRWRGPGAATRSERDRCAIPLSDANLGIARLDMADGALGAAWSQMTELEQALDDPEAIGN
jgi:hypothetical protein